MKLTTDTCIIGGGIAGKYVHSILQDSIILSFPHEYYKGDSVYDINLHLGQIDTWSERAAGFITFPDDKSLDILGWDKKEFEIRKDILQKQLGFRDSEQAVSLQTREYFLQFPKSINLSAIHYLNTLYDFDHPSRFRFQNGYYEHWAARRMMPAFLAAKPIPGYALFFNLSSGKAKSVSFLDSTGELCEIAANNFIIAAHTPGSLRLVQRTIEHNSLSSKYNQYLGMHFCEHPQLSIGTLIHGFEKRRDLPPALIYSDEVHKDRRYRIEINNAPPRYPVILNNIEHFDGLTVDDYVKYFTRCSVVFELPPDLDAHLRFYEYRELFTTRYTIDDFDKYLDEIGRELLPAILEKHFSHSSVKMLNSRFPWRFSGHMAGGLSHQEIFDHSEMHLTFADNLFVASLATFSYLGLFNPTATLLVQAQKLIEQMK